MTPIDKDLVFTGGGGRFNAYYSFFFYQENNGLVHNNNYKVTGVGTGAIAAVLFASGASSFDFKQTSLNLNQSLKTDFEMIRKESHHFQPNMYTASGFDVRSYWEVPLLHNAMVVISRHLFAILVPALKTQDSANPFRYMRSYKDVYKVLYLLLFDYGIIPLFGFRKFIDRRLKDLALKRMPNYRFTDRGLTFKEHRELFQTDLRIVANLANKEQAFEFCSQVTPNVAVADALRAGMATPFVFSPTMGFVHRENLSDPFLRIDHFMKEHLQPFRGLLNATTGVLPERLRPLPERVVDAALQYIKEYMSDSPFRQKIYQTKYNLTTAEVDMLNGIFNEGNMVANFPEDKLQNPTLVLDINNVSSMGRKVKDFPSFFRNIFNALRHNTTLIYAQESEATLAKLNIEPFTEFDYSYLNKVFDQNYKSNENILNQVFQTTSSKTKKK